MVYFFAVEIVRVTEEGTMGASMVLQLRDEELEGKSSSLAVSGGTKSHSLTD